MSDARRVRLPRIGVTAEQLFAPAPGGIGTYVSGLVGALPAVAAGAGSVRWIVGPHADTGLRKAGLDPASTQRLRLPGRAAARSWVTLRRPRLPRSLLERVDLVHATSAAVPPGGGRPLVATVHDLAFRHYPEAYPAAGRRFHEQSARIVADEAALVLVPSRATATDLLEQYGVAAGRVRVTPLAVESPTPDVARAAALLRQLGVAGPYVLAVGTLEPRKNLARLLAAFAACGDLSGHHLVVAGPRGWGERVVPPPAAAGRVHLAGRLERAVLHGLYQQAAAVAYVSLYEGFGLPVLEAMAAGAPVLTSDRSSMPEVAGDAAVLVDPNDEAAIAAGLVRVCLDEPLRARLRVAGPARAAPFTWGATARATWSAYEEALA